MSKSDIVEGDWLTGGGAGRLTAVDSEVPDQRRCRWLGGQPQTTAEGGGAERSFVQKPDQVSERSDQPLALDNLDRPHNVQNLAPVPRDEHARALDVRRKSFLVVHGYLSDKISGHVSAPGIGRSDCLTLFVDDSVSNDARALCDQISHTAREPLEVSACQMALMIGGRGPAFDTHNDRAWAVQLVETKPNAARLCSCGFRDLA
jgi:hypothetical protein